MKITESEKNRIRGLHKNASVIKESWGSKKDEYKRTDGHRDGEVDGHYKAYEGDTKFNEYMEGEHEMEEGGKWGGNKGDYHREMGTDGHMHKTGVQGGGKYGKGGHYDDYMPETDDVIGVDRPESAKAQDEFDMDEYMDVTEADLNMVNEDTEGEETYHYGEDEGEDHDEEMDLEHDEDMAPHDRVDAIQKHLDALKKDMSYDEDREDRDEDGDDFE